MLLIGHRGCAGQYPENTLAAIRACASHVDAIEIDVTRCGTGELILFHDECLGRITGRDGRVDETPWLHIAELTVHDSDEGVPRLGEVAEAWPAGVAMNLDIHEPAIVADALDALAGLDERILLSSKSLGVLAEARQSPVTVERGLSIADPEDGIERALTAGCEFVHVHHELCTETDTVERAHDAGLSVDAWTIDDRTTAAAVARSGVDAMTVDRWDVAGDSERP